jgi:VIT1/CCC1 family predicted Fe2+/Mn2+ transporter
MDNSTIKKIIRFQKQEITEHLIYSELAASTKDVNNKKVLQHIASDELKHYRFWKKYTQKEFKPKFLLAWYYVIISKILGLTFGLKLMERGEKGSQENYLKIDKVVPEVKSMIRDEHEHEKKLIGLLEEEKLHYVGSIVLGLNDALVELTGALAGLTFALNNGRIVALAGLITGIAASLSMAASEYLSRRTDKERVGSPVKASIYTGITYLVTVMLLILPFLLLSNVFFALVYTLVIALIIIFVFTFYTSIAQDLPFRRRFMEMALISLGVATISFGIGVMVKLVWGI